MSILVNQNTRVICQGFPTPGYTLNSALPHARTTSRGAITLLPASDPS
jgi:hypothetical protein